MVDLNGRKPKRLKKGDLRASQAERDDAVRRLRVYEAQGYLDEATTATRVELVEASTTPNEISSVFSDLPALGAKAPDVKARISLDDRAGALTLLKEAMLEDRISLEEYVAAEKLVKQARTREEIDATFHGMTKPRQAIALNQASQVAKRATAATGRTVRAGSRRVVSTLLRAAIAMTLAVIGVVAAIAGSGAVATVCLVCAALSALWALQALIGRRRSQS